MGVTWALHGRYMVVTWSLHGRYTIPTPGRRLGVTWALDRRYTHPPSARRRSGVTWALDRRYTHPPSARRRSGVSRIFCTTSSKACRTPVRVLALACDAKKGGGPAAVCARLQHPSIAIATRQHHGAVRGRPSLHWPHLHVHHRLLARKISRLLDRHLCTGPHGKHGARGRGRALAAQRCSKQRTGLTQWIEG